MCGCRVLRIIQDGDYMLKSTGSTLLSQNLERLLKVYHLQIACSTDLQQVFNHKKPTCSRFLIIKPSFFLLQEILETSDWHRDPAISNCLKSPLLRLCARYLMGCLQFKLLKQLLLKILEMKMSLLLCPYNWFSFV